MHLFRRWSRHHERHHHHVGHDGRFGPFGPVCDAGFYGPLPVHGPYFHFGGFGGFPHGWGGLGRRHGHHGRPGHHGGHGWPGFGGGLGSDAGGRHGERLQARASAFLDLSEHQQALLAHLMAQVRAARSAVKALARGPEVASLIESDNFRREDAQELFDGQIEALRATGPAMVAAFGDFFDALDFDQQQMLRFLLRRLRHRGGRRDGREGREDSHAGEGRDGRHAHDDRRGRDHRDHRDGREGRDDGAF